MTLKKGLKLKKLKPNYKYRIWSIVEVETRKSYIKSLRASALYMEEELTDEDFHKIALGEKELPNLDTYRMEGLQEI